MQVNPSFLTTPEEEPYLLTLAEEDAAINHAISRMKAYYAWRLARQGKLAPQIDAFLSALDWSKDPNINREEILRVANSNKNYEIWQRGQREKEAREQKEKQKELERVWTANQVFKLMRWTSENVYGKKLIVNNETLPLIKTICFFISKDERFVTELGYSFSKGLLIRGVSGLGKTHLVKCVQYNELQPILVLSTLSITEEIKSSGEFPIVTTKMIYIDDVGTEATPVKHYGTEITWFKDFIEQYYATSVSYSRLLISTNLSFDQIELKYGFRVRSRMKDMFNIVNVSGTDLRGL